VADEVVCLHRFHADRPDGKHRDALMLSQQPFSWHFSFFEIGLVFFAIYLVNFHRYSLHYHFSVCPSVALCAFGIMINLLVWDAIWLIWSLVTLQAIRSGATFFIVIWINLGKYVGKHSLCLTVESCVVITIFLQIYTSWTLN